LGKLDRFAGFWGNCGSQNVVNRRESSLHGGR
jgi:hypothetical protein